MELTEYALTKAEAHALAEFIDYNLFQWIRNDTEINGMAWLRNIIHAYEKLSAASGYVGWSEAQPQEIEHPFEEQEFPEVIETPEPIVTEEEPIEDEPDEKSDKKKVDEGKICALYKADFPVSEICAEVHCSTKRVYEVLKRNGIPKRKK